MSGPNAIDTIPSPSGTSIASRTVEGASPIPPTGTTFIININDSPHREIAKVELNPGIGGRNRGSKVVGEGLPGGSERRRGGPHAEVHIRVALFHDREHIVRGVRFRLVGQAVLLALGDSRELLTDLNIPYRTGNVHDGFEAPCPFVVLARHRGNALGRAVLPILEYPGGKHPRLEAAVGEEVSAAACTHHDIASLRF